MEYFLPFSAAILLGLAKSGFKGIAPLFIIMLTIHYGVLMASAIVVPILIIGDVMALYWYRKYVHKQTVYKFLPWVIVGLLVGVYFGNDLPEWFFKDVVGVLILVNLVIFFIYDIFLKKIAKKNAAFEAFLGFVSGFYSMVGNFAGVFANIYFLKSGLLKNNLIATGTLVFFIANLLKIPFHLFIWETISTETIAESIKLTPLVIIGFLAGTKLIAKLNNDIYRKILFGITFLVVIAFFVYRY